MTQPQILEGTWEEILAQNAELLAGRRVKVYIEPEESETDGNEAYSLETAMTRLNSRTAEEIASARKRILDAAPEPEPVPEGKTLADVIVGQWPGDETDEEINEALRKLS